MAGLLSFAKFKIEGLRGARTIDVNIEDNTIIMVGENGSGKTTFLRMLFYFLSGRWRSLAQFDFKSISATINGKEYKLEKTLIESALPRVDEKTFLKLPPHYRRRYTELRDFGHIDEAEEFLSELMSRHNTPTRAQLENEFKKSATELSKFHQKLSKNLDAQILYLPTYRRIERELGSIFQGLDPDDSRRAPSIARQQENGNDYVELVEFGMNDVKKAIDRTLNEIRNFQLDQITQLSRSYLGDVVSQSYKDNESAFTSSASEETIDATLNRIDDSILNNNNKHRLKEIISSINNNSKPSEHELIAYHYFSKLLKVQEKLRDKEKNINSFCDLCSIYITDKKFVYESAKFSFKIEHATGDIKLSDLSSGEKQIVSLFSHLYLSGRERFFVLIDEPELSLSVPWQRRFLVDIRDASFCSGLVAVTHSPFIYDNKLRPNTHALGEFVRGADWGNIQ